MKDSNKIKKECMNNESAMNNVGNATNDECINITLEELEKDGLVPPSDFNSETEPTSLLDAIDFVNDTLQRYMNILGEFDFADCHGSALDYLARRLHITPTEAFLFCICVDEGPNNITFTDFARKLELSKARAMSLATHLDSLVRNRLLGMSNNHWGEMAYKIPNRIIRTLTTNSDYQPPQRKFNDDEALLGYFHSFVADINNFNMNQEMVFEEVEELLNENKELRICREIGKLELMDQSVLMLLLFCDKLVSSNDKDVNFCDLDDLFPNNQEFYNVRMAMRSGHHELMREGLVEHLCFNGIADTGTFSLTNKARKKLLANIKLTRGEEKLEGVLKSTTIAPKELFYSDKVSKQVNDLQHFLESQKYKEIVERMRKRYSRSGLTCLLYGGPGTGKTETVYQLARETGRDIMAVDFSQIKSKWVGESEKNIKELFNHYRKLVEKAKVTPILLFNEADAIFGVRMTGAQRSVDKMENSMQNIILQEMETLNGILIATTNLTENLDAAFERRFLYKVQFERPDESVRARIWHQMLPELSENECKTLGREYDLSGGQIENVARKFAIDGILHGEESGDRLNLLHELCGSECIIDNNTNARRVGFVA